jgi:hypothetical protein
LLAAVSTNAPVENTSFVIVMGIAAVSNIGR